MQQWYTWTPATSVDLRLDAYLSSGVHDIFYRKFFNWTCPIYICVRPGQ
jgi:hypothetical protein